MEVIKARLQDVQGNEKNPRTISDVNLTKLIRSIIEFPEMLDIRPIVVDDNNTILGGNMRHKALNIIATMTIDAIRSELGSLNSFKIKSKEDVSRTINHGQSGLNRLIYQSSKLPI